MLKYGLLTYICPNLAQELKGSLHRELFDRELAKLDTKVCSKVSLSKEDYVRPLRQLAKLIQRGRAVSLNESLREWELALKNCTYRFPKQINKLKKELSSQEFSKLDFTPLQDKKKIKE
ncbi:UNVERIFIED_CONTAM: hypothetical protein PYX00_010986 [Menopon gallinae]|uniref:Uncharacterized protein n=1 Tax=Menopon gallinae TaxID=328185 RepID=A0AAW2H6Y2_9NEOP